MSSWPPPHAGGLALQPVCGHWGQREQAANRSQTPQLSQGSLADDMKELSPLDTHGVRSDPKQRRPIKRRLGSGSTVLESQRSGRRSSSSTHEAVLDGARPWAGVEAGGTWVTFPQCRARDAGLAGMPASQRGKHFALKWAGNGADPRAAY
ncbi:unnamed protein product [Boreogadus saida]